MTTTRAHHAERITVGIDGSLESRCAVRWAIDHARPGDTVRLVHAWSPSPATVDSGMVDPDDESGAAHLVDRELARAADLPRADGVILTGTVVRGDPRRCLAGIPTDILVLGRGRHGAIARTLLGSVCIETARHARATTVIVPSSVGDADRDAR